MDEVHHIEALFHGRVQGVGFRYAAFQVAREFEVSGFAENLPDGRVRVEVEAASVREGEAYLAALEEKMHGYIRKAERNARARVRQFEGFVIR
jgi:acylphosphatase